MDGQKAGRTEPLVLSEFINRSVQPRLWGPGAAPRGRGTVSWRGGSPLCPALTWEPPPPGSETSSVPGGAQARAELELGRGWLWECDGFCDFDTNNTLIPVEVRAGPSLRSGGVWTLHPSSHPIHAGRGGGPFSSCLVLGGPPSPRPTLVLPGGVVCVHGGGRLRAGGPAAAPAGSPRCPGSRPPERCRTGGR